MRLIDANAIKTCLEHEAWSKGRIELLRARDIIDETPTVDAMPVRHGEWLPIIEVNECGEPYQSGVYCSECGETSIYEPNYCPHCGARMDEK